MKSAAAAIAVLFLAATFAAGQTFYGTTDLGVFRDGRDKEFRDRAESPLTDEDLAAFDGLRYFRTDRRFRVTARLVRTSDEKVFRMPTSSGRSKRFVKYGLLKFSIAKRPYTLSVFRPDAEARAKHPEYADLLFVPFRDRTSVRETYGVGRYIDIRAPKGDRVTLDFNLAYNPNCAYGSDKYSCPIPPKENFLRLRVTAGELNYRRPVK
jgi:uncharacterized protein (DUF1684 family)